MLVQELLEELALYPDHLELTVAGAPRLDATLEEVGVQSYSAPGGTRTPNRFLRTELLFH